MGEILFGFLDSNGKWNDLNKTKIISVIGGDIVLWLSNDFFKILCKSLQILRLVKKGDNRGENY